MNIQLETLQKEYDVKLTEYQEAVNNYIALLESDEANQFTALKGRTWWGTGALDEKKVDSQADCENMCLETKECTGATFHEESRYCWTRKGKSQITSGRDDDYALVPQIVAALERMKYLNQQLIQLNAKMGEQVDLIHSSAVDGDEISLKRTQLNTNYDQLMEQNVRLNAQLEEYNSMEEEQEKQTLYADQQNASFKIWTIVAGVLLLVALKGFYGAENSTSFFTFGITLMILAVTLSFALRSPSGFFAVFMLVVAIAGMKMS